MPKSRSLERFRRGETNNPLAFIYDLYIKFVMQFEWNDQKRITNLGKHGLDFFDEVDVFDTPHLVVPSAHDSEQRFLAIGTIQGRFVTVVYTMRSAAIRIISFRRSRHEERQKYLAFYGK
jgi:uncharacterized DUF497 family protein